EEAAVALLTLPQRLLRALALDHAPELRADVTHDSQQRLIRFPGLLREEFQHRYYLRAHQHRETESGLHADVRRRPRPGKIHVLGHIDDPRRLLALQHPAR